MKPHSEIYLDSNATTKVLDSVAQVVNELMSSTYGNPSSSHIAGVRVKHLIETVREQARAVIGAKHGNIIFTCGATEGIQTAVLSALVAGRNKPIDGPKYILYGATEHKAVPNSLIHWRDVLEIDAEVLPIPVDDKGLLCLDFIDKHCANSLMVCTMAVNNETGVFQDLDAVERTIRSRNPDVPWLVDCVQALGKTQLKLSDTSIDYAVFSGHKLYAPKGVGMIYIGQNSPATAFLAGGGQEGGMRSGTENTPGIAALGKVFSLLLDEQDDTFKSVSVLQAYRQQLADTLKAVFPQVVFNHDFAYSVPTTLNFSVKGMSSKEVMDLFDAAAIRVSSGSACSSKSSRSFVLDAMAVAPWQSESAIRLSFGPAATQAEIDSSCAAIESIKPALQNSCFILSDAREVDGTPAQSGLIQLQSDDCCCWVYIDNDSKECIIVDPVAQLNERLERWVECRGLMVKAVIDTHVHYDHPSCHHWLRNQLVAAIPEHLQQTNDHGWPLHCDGELKLAGMSLPYISVGAYRVAVVNTPGHTQDSQSLLLVDSKAKIKLALVGDLLIPGGFGRTDVQTGDSSAFYQSLLTLSRLIGQDTLIGSSHDYQHALFTTLACECEHNELLCRVLNEQLGVEEFVSAKAHIDQQLQQSSSGYLCGLIDVGEQSQPYSLMFNDVSAFLAEHPDATVIDIREPYEYQVGNLSALLPLQHKPVQVGLSKLAAFVIEKQFRDTGPILLVCRTGNRSLLACKSLLRLGYVQVFNIRGGLALQG